MKPLEWGWSEGAGPSRVVCSINQSSWKDSGGQVSVAREVVRYFEVGSVGGVSASQGQQGCTGSGWADHRGVRDRPDEVCCSQRTVTQEGRISPEEEGSLCRRGGLHLGTLDRWS